MRIEQEEVFGPVMSVLTFDELDDAVRIANGVQFGLTGSIWTRDVSTAVTLADRLDAGYVWVNGSSRHFWACPSAAPSPRALAARRVSRSCCPTPSSKR